MIAGRLGGHISCRLRCCPALKEADRFISLGGGNAAGEFTAEALQSISGSLDAIVAANYTGVVFDVEEVLAYEPGRLGFAAVLAHRCATCAGHRAGVHNGERVCGGVCGVQALGSEGRGDDVPLGSVSS